MSNDKITSKFKLNSLWQTMSATQKRSGVLVITLVSVFFLMSFITRSGQVSSTPSRNEISQNILTDINTREIGIDSLNSKVKVLKKENEDLNDKVERFQKEIERINKRRGNDPDISKEVRLLQVQLESLTKKAQSLGWEVEDIKDGYIQSNNPKNVTSTQTQTQKSKPPSLQKPIQAVLTNHQTSEGAISEQDYFAQLPDKNKPIRTVNLSTNDEQQQLTIQTFKHESAGNDDNAMSIQLPSGSILSGVNLNGLDAATGRGSRNDPFPILVRIQKDAILPNQYRSDVKECFATLSGYGDLSTERAYLRGETLSCIGSNGTIFESAFPAYAVGQDGKAGLRGRLVSKAGSLIAKTALAGFAAGVSQAFNTTPVPVVQTEGITSERTFQNNFSSDSFRQGASNGASEALSRLADYYMDMADQIFPVVEIDVGRQIDIVLIKQLELKEKGAL